MKRIIVGVSGASGMPLALCLLRHLAALPDVESHLILSPGAHAVLEAECGLAPSTLHALSAMMRPVWEPPRPAAPGSTTAWWSAPAP